MGIISQLATALIRFKRGQFVDLPMLNQGEPAFTTDTEEFFIGGVNGAVQIGRKPKTTIYADNPPAPLLPLAMDGTDDRAKLQAMLDYLVDGGEIVIPANKLVTIASENPTHAGMGLILEKNNVTLRSEGANHNDYSITCTIPLDTLCYAPTRIDGLQFIDISIDCANNVDYGFKTNDVYCAYTYWKNAQFTRAKVLNVFLQTFVAQLDRCLFTSSEQDGVKIAGVGTGIATSVTLNSCYANDNANKGFDFKNTVYTNLVSCACDNSLIGYNFDTVQSVNMLGCGAENVDLPVIVDGYGGFGIKGLYLNGVGNVSPVQFLIEFKDGLNATVEGIHEQGSTGQYLYKLGSTGTSTGGENITVTDWSVTRSQMYFVDTFQFDRPIKLLRGDETTKDETFTVNVDDLPVKLIELEGMIVNHTITIQVNDGVQGDLGLAQKIENLHGSGKIIIQGNSGDRTAVELHGGENRLQVTDCTIPVILKDLTVDNRLSSNFSRLIVANNANLKFDNVLLNNGLASCGAGVDAFRGTSIFVDELTEASGNFEGASAYKFYNLDATSELNFADRAAAPSGFGSVGWRIYNSAPVAGGSMGWVCTTRGTSPVYKTFGTIQA